MTKMKKTSKWWFIDENRSENIIYRQQAKGFPHCERMECALDPWYMYHNRQWHACMDGWILYNTVNRNELVSFTHYWTLSWVFYCNLCCIVLYCTVLTRVDPLNASENDRENMKYNTKTHIKHIYFYYLFIYYVKKKWEPSPHRFITDLVL